MKKLKAITIVVCGIIIMYVIQHSTPSIALRTHLFGTGHPFTLLTTGITDDEIHNRVDKRRLERQNAKCYMLTKSA